MAYFRKLDESRIENDSRGLYEEDSNSMKENSNMYSQAPNTNSSFQAKSFNNIVKNSRLASNTNSKLETRTANLVELNS